MAPSDRRKSPLQTIHIIMVGSGGVGKSALTSQFMFGDFPAAYHPTRADSFNKVVQVDGQSYNVDVLDTAGQESYAAIRDNYFRSGDGFLCVFGIDDRQSFEAVVGLREQICSALDNDEPTMVLVGNKTDLGEAARKVHRQEVISLVKGWGNCLYLETSAKEKVNVEEAFTSLLRNIVEQKKRAAEKAGVRRETKHKKSFCSSCTIQ